MRLSLRATPLMMIFDYQIDKKIENIEETVTICAETPNFTVDEVELEGASDKSFYNPTTEQIRKEILSEFVGKDSVTLIGKYYGKLSIVFINLTSGRISISLPKEDADDIRIFEKRLHLL